MHKKSAFTIMELIIVVVIIGVLAAIAIPSYRIQMLKMKNQEAVCILMAVWEAQKEYYRENGVYANNINLLAVDIPTSKNFNNPEVEQNYFFGKNLCPLSRVLAMVETKDGLYKIFVTEGGYIFASCFICNDALDQKMGLPYVCGAN